MEVEAHDLARTQHRHTKSLSMAHTWTPQKRPHVKYGAPWRSIFLDFQGEYPAIQPLLLHRQERNRPILVLVPTLKNTVMLAMMEVYF